MVIRVINNVVFNRKLLRQQTLTVLSTQRNTVTVWLKEWRKLLWSSLMAKRMNDPVLAQLWLWFNACPGNFHMLWVWPKIKRQKQNPQKWIKFWFFLLFKNHIFLQWEISLEKEAYLKGTRLFYHVKLEHVADVPYGAIYFFLYYLFRYYFSDSAYVREWYLFQKIVWPLLHLFYLI